MPDGCFALVTRFGKDEDYEDGNPIWPAGFHFGPPWLKVEFLITKQSVVFNMPVKGCKTNDNVTVQINLAVVFRTSSAAKIAVLAGAQLATKASSDNDIWLPAALHTHKEPQSQAA